VLAIFAGRMFTRACGVVMRLIALAIAIIAGAVLTSAAKALHMKAFQSGAWEGEAYYGDDNGAVALCSISARYDNGLSLSIVLEAGGGWSFLFVRPEGFSSAPVTYALYADDKMIHSGQGVPEAGGQLLRIEAPFSEETLQRLERGTMLRVLSSYGDAGFSLKGSAKAITELRRCVAGRSANAFGPGMNKDESRLEKAAPKEDRSGPRIVGREELIPYATEILKNAGFADYRFLPTEERSVNVLAWQFDDGAFGSLAAVEKAASVDLDRFIGDITAADTGSCKGEFANGKRAPRYVNGVEIRKVFASCSAGPKSFYVEYALVRLPSGFLVKLASATHGSSTLLISEKDSRNDRDRVDRTEQSTLATLSKH
jgi:hypothetical protein